MTQTRIAVAARKGGIGKTSIACGLASVMSSQGKRVLVIDLDPQSNAAYVLGTDPTAPGTADLLSGGLPVVLEASLGLYVLPGGPDLSGHTIQSLDPEDLADAVGAMDYDVLIFDCPPGVEYLERLALVAADVALICTDAHPLGVMGAGRVINELKLRQRSMDQSLDQQLATAYPVIGSPKDIRMDKTTLPQLVYVDCSTTVSCLSINSHGQKWQNPQWQAELQVP